MLRLFDEITFGLGGKKHATLVRSRGAVARCGGGHSNTGMEILDRAVKHGSEAWTRAQKLFGNSSHDKPIYPPSRWQAAIYLFIIERFPCHVRERPHKWILKHPKTKNPPCSTAGSVKT